MDITGANVNQTLSIIPLFTVPQQIQGFASDEIYDFDEIESVETMMGVDGVLSGGFVWKAQMQTFTLQADSASCLFFDAWYAQQTAALTTYIANGVLILPSIGRKFIQTAGYLRRYKLPGAKKLLTPRRFGIEWNQVISVPV